MFNQPKFSQEKTQNNKKNNRNGNRRPKKPDSNSNIIDDFYDKDRPHRSNNRNGNRQPKKQSKKQSNKKDTDLYKVKNDTGSWANRVKTPAPVKLDPNKVHEDGRHIKLRDRYVLWCHDIYNKNWNISSYKRLCIIENVADFWKLFNNFHKLGMRFNHYFLMKDYTEPTWEHVSNRGGGICSFKMDLDDSPAVWSNLIIKMVCGMLCDQLDDINGISISPKNNWGIIKIWNKDRKNDLAVTLKEDILEKYKDLTIRYQANAPEY